MECALDWLIVSKDILVIHYEDFKTDLEKELRLMHRFLNLNVDDKRLECLIKNPVNLWKRKVKPVIKNKTEIYKPHVKKSLDQAIDLLQSILKARNLRTIPLDKYAPYYTKSRDNNNNKHTEL